MIEQIAQKIRILYASNKLPWIIICVGIVLRLIRYLHNPSLWFDESDIAIDIIRTPFSEIIYPSPDYTKTYPYLFVMLIKLFTQVFGNSEYVFRLFPLLSGIASLFLFYRVAKHYIDGKALLIALGLFAILDSLVFESANLKPYSSDILFILIIYTLVIYIQSKELNLPRMAILGGTGVLAIWFSNPSVFVLAGVGACLVVFSFTRKDWKEAGRLAITGSIWILGFIANYFIYIRNLQASFSVKLDEILSVLEKAYMPVPPRSIADIKWFMDLFFDIFNYPLAMTLTGISALAFLVGCVSFYSRNSRRFIIILSPMVVTFIAAALHQYPFRSRFIFFLVPLMLLFIAEGAEYIRSRIIQHSKVVGIIFISLLLIHPLTTSAYRIITPSYQEDIKPVLKYIKEHWQEGDMVYVHYYAQYPFEYYSKYHPELYGFNEDDYIIGIAPRGWYRYWRKRDVAKYYGSEEMFKQSSFDIFDVYKKDLDPLKGKERVWVIFTTAIKKDGISEEKYLVYYLETSGKQMDFFGRSGVSAVYLYDLSEKPSDMRN